MSNDENTIPTKVPGDSKEKRRKNLTTSADKE
jgi:hypothetical protein